VDFGRRVCFRELGLVGRVDRVGVGMVDWFVGSMFFAEALECDTAVQERDPETEPAESLRRFHGGIVGEWKHTIRFHRSLTQETISFVLPQ
jgi:hypothetical protein